MRPAAIIYHRIPYAGVFEQGAVIRGKPYLWLPLESVPVRAGGRRMTPRQYVRSIGPLVTIVSRSGTPMLIAKYQRTDGRRRAGAAVRDKRKPLYVGVAIAFIDKRFDIAGAAARASARLPALYEKHFRAE